jgi:RNA polymerase sigma-70 factor, ECF subfamily
MEEAMNEQQLLMRAADGDEVAFTILYGRYRDAVYRFAWAVTRSDEDAEEVAQDSFMTLLRKAGDYRPEAASLRSWLLGITRNLGYRRRGRRETEELSGAAQIADAADVAAIEAALIRNQTAEAVRRAVMALPAPQREAMVLFEFEELSLAETGAILGIEANAVKARLHRGRARLREMLPSLEPEGRNSAI